MTKLLRKAVILVLLFSLLFGSTRVLVSDDTSQISSIKECADANISVADCPSYLQKKVNDLQSQADTLSSQIAVMNNQIALTEARIAANEKQISDLTLDIDTADKKIDSLQSSLDQISQVLINRIRSTYEVGTIQPVQILLSSSDTSNFLQRLNYLKIAQEHDRKLILETTAAKNDYSNQKNILEDKKKQIEELKKQQEDYTNQLAVQKQGEQTLLTQTQGSESTYQSLLSQSKAQLAAFQGFVQSQGGASLLSNQTVCDDWGCYYNQRDSQWGGLQINGSSGTTIAESGCLMTSIAMVYSHFGHKVTPLDVNIGSNFFSSTAYLLRSISVAGVSSSRVGASIDSELSGGNPVIVGISYDGGPIPDHFVVLVSGSGGNYIMNDPFTPNGHNISFSSHYSVGAIKEIDKVVF